MLSFIAKSNIQALNSDHGFADPDDSVTGGTTINIESPA